MEALVEKVFPQFRPDLMVPNDIMQMVYDDLCRVFDLTPDKLKDRTRATEVVIPRHLFQFLCNRIQVRPIRLISLFIQRADHSVNCVSVARVNNALKMNDPVIIPWILKYKREGNPGISKYLPVPEQLCEEANEVFSNNCAKVAV